jgi:hypothetical protein
MTGLPPDQLSDRDLLTELVRLGDEVVRACQERQAYAGRIVDDPRWTHSVFPLRFEVQVHSLFLGALDAFDVVVHLLDTRASQQAFNMIRFQVETLALVRWMAESDDPQERQWRAYRVLCGQLARWSKILTQDAAKDPAEAQEVADRAEAAKEKLRQLAQEDYGRPPKEPLGRPQLFAKYLKEGGYETFGMQSELGSHPGAAGNLLFAVDETKLPGITFDFRGAFGHRAYWAGTALLFLHLTIREVGVALGWKDWLDDTLAQMFKHAAPYLLAAAKRKREARERAQKGKTVATCNCCQKNEGTDRAWDTMIVPTAQGNVRRKVATQTLCDTCNDGRFPHYEPMAGGGGEILSCPHHVAAESSSSQDT